MADVIIKLDVDDVIRKYLGGMSELELSQRFNVSRGVIRRRLLHRGIKPRTQTEASIVMASKMSVTERKERIKKAQATVRGSRRSWETKCKGAKTRENLRLNVSPIEDELFKFFKQKGFEVTQQKAVGAYNLDIALERERIAIEIFGGGFHKAGRHKARFFDRNKYILNQGWGLIIVWLHAKRHPLTLSGMDYLLSFCKVPSRYKTKWGRYKVIWGNGYDVPALGSYFNDPPAIKRLCCGDNIMAES